MLKIGLTGGLGCGKSTVANYFADLGVDIIDADEISREIVAIGQPALKDIANHFGLRILKQDGTLDRSKLRKIILKSPDEKHWLEQLLHPLILNEIKTRLKNVTSHYCILVIPLLLETGCFDLVDRILVVDTSLKLQIQRIQARSNWSEEEIKAMIETQVKRDERLAHADDVIKNDGTLEELKEQVLNIMNSFP